MLTSFKQKNESFEPEEVMLDESKISTNKIGKVKVRLTEDLMYIVNKKLKSKDKETRDQKLKASHRPNDPDPIEPFTEVSYRTRSDLNLSQTQLAVVHESYFKSNSVAVCEIDSMETFFHAVDRAWFRSSCRDFKDLIWIKRPDFSKVKNPVARFFQLPMDYIRPHCDSLYLGELAFKLNKDPGLV